ncbi:hypothetical protein NDU88_005203 [Pleurodeles waltl]|uniref:Uncharacterized protein n=1 Tax=Pleurodeles waltl TaxID=8319 RepID=A0AAV7TU57_PLEWA|nr:hypothetical protein NDU88_005203 [Pleurodeles waltl]
MRGGAVTPRQHPRSRRKGPPRVLQLLTQTAAPTAVRGQIKGAPRAPRPLTRATAPTAARSGDAAAAAARKYSTTTPVLRAVCGEDRRPTLGPRPRRGKKNNTWPEKRAAAGPATLNTDRGSHRGTRSEKRAAAGPATPNTSRQL